MLTQVRAAVARLEADACPARPARSRSSATQPIPLAKDAVAEAIAFLEWLRDDNFTFLGMREFSYSGGEKSGTLSASASRRASASSPIPTCGCCAATEGEADDAGDPRLPLRPRSADRHQGQRQVDRAPPRLSRLCRRQDLRQEGRAYRRAAHRRPVHLDRLHALGDEDPLSALQGRDRHPEVRLRPARPFRQGADQRAGKLSARRTVPDRRADPAQACRGDPRPRRAPARPGALPRRPVRPFRLGHRLRAARPL